MTNEGKRALLETQKICFLVDREKSYLLIDLLNFSSITWLKGESNHTLLLKSEYLSVSFFEDEGVSEKSVNEYSLLINSLNLLISSSQFKDAFDLIEKSLIIEFVDTDYSKLTKEALENEAEIV